MKICSFSGVTPCIITIDPEFIREVTVKQFDNFTDRLDIDFSPEQTTLDFSGWVSVCLLITALQDMK